MSKKKKIKNTHEFEKGGENKTIAKSFVLLLVVTRAIKIFFKLRYIIQAFLNITIT